MATAIDDLERAFLLAQLGDSGMGKTINDLRFEFYSAMPSFVREDQVPLNIRDFGGVGDGIAVDDTAAAAMFASTSAGDRVTFGKGTFKLTQGLNIPSGVHVDLTGATLDFTSMPDGVTLAEKIGLSATGSLSAALPVSNAIAQWSRTVTGISSTATLAAGDLILLRNDERPVPGMTRTDRDKGELQIIQSVDSGTQITLTSGALFAYGTTSLEIVKVNPVENITIKGGKILMGGVNSAHVGVQIRYGKNIKFDSVMIDGAEDTAISLRTIYDSTVDKCTISNSTSNAGIGNTGYGVAIVEGSRNIRVGKNNFYNCRHFVAGGGFWPAVFVDIHHNQGERSSDAAYDCHESTLYWTFTKNMADGVASGFIVRGQYITIDGNKITNSLGRAYRAATFDLVTEQRGIRFINNEATNCVYGLEMDGQAAGAEPNCLKIDCNISRNILRDCGPNPILLRHFQNVKMDDNEIYGSTNHAILCLGLAIGTPSTGLKMRGCQVTDSGLDSIKVQFVDDVMIDTPIITNAGSSGIEMLTCNRTMITNHQIRTYQQNGIFVSAGAVHSISGGIVTGQNPLSTTFDALRFSGTDAVDVSGGYYTGPRYGVNSTTTTNVSVSGVNARDAVGSGGVKINVDAANKSVTANLIT